MQHPRRNEVYRDVGSEAHTLDEPGFIETCRDCRSSPTRACSSAVTD